MENKLKASLVLKNMIQLKFFLYLTSPLSLPRLCSYSDKIIGNQSKTRFSVT